MLAKTRGGMEYLVSARQHRRWSSEEEIALFQELETKEKRLYTLIFSFRPLGKENIKKLSAFFAIEKEEKPTIARQLKLMMRYYEEEKLTKVKLRSLTRFINEVTDQFRLLEAPRLWTRFVMTELCDPKKLTMMEDFEFFWNRVQDKEYLAWSKKVIEASNEISQKKNDFVEDNIGLISSIIKRRVPAGSNVITPFMDLQQEGAFGLLKSMDKFDYKRGLKFSTYASWWVRHSLSRAICDKDKMIRIPVHVHDKIARVRMFQNEFIRKNGRDASVEEIMLELQMPERHVREMMQSSLFFSFDAKLGDGENETDFYGLAFEPEASFDTYVNPKSSFDELCSKELRRRLVAAIRRLSPKERAIIRGRFGIGSGADTDETATLKEIGNGFDLSRERIRQIETVALGKLRAAMKNKKIHSVSDISAN